MNKDNTNAGYRVVQEESKGIKIYRTIMLILIVALLTFIITTAVMYSKFSKDKENIQMFKSFISDKDTKSTTQKLEEFRQLIDKYYLGEVNEEDLQEGAIAGYIAGLKDPYTEYISKDEIAEYTQDIMGNFIGIGIYMVQDKETDRILVLTPIKYGPAEKAGIQPGDYIKSIDGVEYKGSQLSEAADKVKGEEGTEVKLEIVRDGETINFSIKRENIKVNPVEGEVLENNIGYIEFSSFDENTASDFRAKYEELEKKGIKSLIIDLRNNGGGIVDEAVSIAGTILDKDSTVLYEVNKNKEEKEIKTTQDPIINVPIIILQNKNTASASEILAGALKDYGKAKLIGTTTFGKGVIQQLMQLTDGSGLKITTAEYFTAKRNKINEIGIEPDEKVELPNELQKKVTIEKDKDTQLQKAIELLKQQ